MSKEKVNNEKNQLNDLLEKHHEMERETLKTIMDTNFQSTKLFPKKEREIIKYTRKEVRSEIIATVYTQCFFHIFTIGLSLFILHGFIVAFHENITSFLFVLPLVVMFSIWVIIIEIYTLRFLKSQIRRICRMKKYKEAK